MRLNWIPNAISILRILLIIPVLELILTDRYEFALFLFLMAIAVTGFVVFVERGQRRITVNYAKRQQGRKVFQAQSTHLPLKLNMAGVIPPIFASSIILFPTTLAQWAGNTEGMRWLQDIVSKLSPGEPIYVAMYAAAIIFFCFFFFGLTILTMATTGLPLPLGTR